MKTYIVTKDTTNLDTKVIYAGTDASKAQEICDTEYEKIDGRKLHTFIEVWENGERDYTTRKLQI